MREKHPMKAMRIVALGIFVLVAGVVVWSLLRPAVLSTGLVPGAGTGTAEDTVAVALARVAGGADATLPKFVTGLENLPASLQGTEIDGELRADAAGHLVIGNEVRRVFDWFLAALGEEPLAVLIARLHAHFDQVLPPVAAGEARALLANYLAYREALGAIDAPTATPGEIDLAALRARQAEAQALRSGYFSAEAATAFYADDDAWDDYALARLAVLQRNDIPPAQQASELAALHEALPEALQESVRAIGQYQDLEALTGDWTQRGGSAAELRQIRENLVGPAAADRLEALDAQRGDWDRRMGNWLAERAAVLGNAGLDGTERERQVSALRAQRFSSEEVVRVQALEAMHDQGLPPPGASPGG
jgi:lipase chaperone LimK